MRWIARIQSQYFGEEKKNNCIFSKLDNVINNCIHWRGYRKQGHYRSKATVKRSYGNDLDENLYDCTANHLKVLNIANTWVHSYCLIQDHNAFKPVGRGGVRGGSSEPPFDLQKNYYTPLTKCPTVWKWSNSLPAIENHCCPNESGCSRLYASLFTEDQRGTHA